MIRATKIVATLGPASSDAAVLRQLIAAGVDVVRLNFSHGTADDHRARAQLVRQVSADLGREVAIMADLQGPKIRVGKFESGKIFLKAGDTFILDAACTLGNQERVGLDYKDLPKDVKAKDKLLLNDGLLVFEVQRVEGSSIHVLVELGGELSNNKGINRAGGGLSAPALTEKDKQDLVSAVELEADYIAISFPKNAQDMLVAKALVEEAAKKNQHQAKLIAKIERAEAVIDQTLQEILDVSDGIMVARGDLAVEVGNAAVPALQKKMIRMARDSNKLVITATQMMESMIQNPVPTRAEVSDVANAVLDGTDAVMLSAETASGQYPVETVKQMANICLEAEKTEVHHLDSDFFDQQFSRIDQSIAFGALFTAYHLGVKAIAALTDSGSTALWMSRHKIRVPIFAMTPKKKTERKMALYRNVHPLRMDTSNDRDTALAQAEAHLKNLKVVAANDTIVLTVGEPMGAVGGTNTLKIVKVK
jgi:pyruvate kinase